MFVQLLFFSVGVSCGHCCRLLGYTTQITWYRDPKDLKTLFVWMVDNFYAGILDEHGLDR